MGNKDTKVALCYVRLSFTRHDDDANSPERQRANIEATCQKHGWQPEWYEDVGGHKSGRYERNRPQWLALKKRLGDSDVVALVANDMARLHRKGWRIGDLIEHLDKYNIGLVLAAPGREVDTSTPQGRIFAQFGAIFDEYYASDLSVRAKDSVAYRKSQGKSIGMPPFGTERDDNGYLMPTDKGVWLLEDGRFHAGHSTDEKPFNAAVWHGYYDAALHVLKLYSDGGIGLEKIAYQMNDEGWAFRNRKGVPRPFNRADVRRIIANWPEYGGIVLDNKAVDRPAYEYEDEIPYDLNPDRAVFPIDLLLTVAAVRKERSIRPRNHGVNRKVNIYPLAGVTYCAYCEKLAASENNSQLRTRFSGAKSDKGVFRYRHKPGVKCGSHNRSVAAAEYEVDFRHLLDLLTIDESSIELMKGLAIEADRGMLSDEKNKNIEQEKAEAIARCRRRIDAALHLYSDGDLSREEYLSRKEQNEREIAHWEARTTETAKLGMELAMCMNAIDKIVRLWDNSSNEDRHGFVQNLFEYIVYDLDTRRIVDFRLKAWADRFLVLRAALYSENEKIRIQRGDTDIPHRRLELLFSP